MGDTTLACKVYGHNTMFTLRASEGFLCCRFWAATEIEAAILFTEPKTAKGWLAKAKKAGWQIEAAPQHVTAHPSNLLAIINPSDNEADIAIILKKSFYRNW